MKQIQETDKLILFEEVQNRTTKIYRQHKEDENEEKILIYSKKDNEITYNFEGESIKRIIVEGEESLPGFLNYFGYGFKEKSINNFFRYNFSDNRIDTLVFF